MTVQFRQLAILALCLMPVCFLLATGAAVSYRVLRVVGWALPLASAGLVAFLWTQLVLVFGKQGQACSLHGLVVSTESEVAWQAVYRFWYRSAMA